MKEETKILIKECIELGMFEEALGVLSQMDRDKKIQELKFLKHLHDVANEYDYVPTEDDEEIYDPTYKNYQGWSVSDITSRIMNLISEL